MGLKTQCIADIKRGYKRNYDKYINKRDKYRKEVSLDEPKKADEEARNLK